MDKVKQIAEDLKQGWNKLDRTKRIRLLLVVLSFLILVSGTAWWLQRTDYDVLFKELDPADAGQITQNLDSQGMKYKLEDGGTTVLIDRKYIDKYRIDLAVDGLLPENSTGFEIFNNTSMMATDEDRQIMYQRAIQGELERAISSLSSIDSAKVMLSLPEDSIFQNPDYQKEATASIVLKTKGKNALSNQAIQGIASLVSGAVEKLPMANIRIIDSNGNLLSRSLQTNDSGYTSDLVTQRKAIERDYEFQLEQKILSLLGPIYGLDKVQVSVFAELNFDAGEMESTTYNNKGDESVRSEQESVSGNGGLVQGVQGGTLDDNAGAVIEEGNGDDESAYDRTTNYELDTIKQTSVTAPGAPRNLTASVVIKGNRIDTINEQNLIENALGGIGTASVQYVPDVVDNPSLLPPTGDIGGKLLAFLKGYWMYLAAILVLMLATILLLNKRRKKAQFDEWDSFDDFDEEEEIEETEIEQKEPEPTRAEKEKAIKIAREQQVSDEKEKEVRAYTSEHPEMASELIKIWLNEKKV